MNDALYYTTHDSAIGTLLLVASPSGLRYVALLENAEEAGTHLALRYGTPPAPALYELGGFFAGAVAAIDDYLARGTELKLPVDLAGGTPLQRAVWIAISRIPYGETLSYGQLAERVGFPRAVRAVASACGANPVPLAIPCHRVVGKDGSLTGFSLGGIGIKQRLLALESGMAAQAA